MGYRIALTPTSENGYLGPVVAQYSQPSSATPSPDHTATTAEHVVSNLLQEEKLLPIFTVDPRFKITEEPGFTPLLPRPKTAIPNPALLITRTVVVWKEPNSNGRTL
ncbi:MAG: hypothetical protein S4CHLAM102_06800 [Chlamydiia bacterium]|nr:hypothetical protein [Chlamydiia bacterium]